jgi:uncharacterized delta-60 repeat protein
MKNNLFITAILLMVCQLAFSQDVAQQWVSRYNGSMNLFDEGNAIILDASGYIYVTGSSFGTGTSRDYFTIKYNQLGDTQWVRRYNGLINAGDYSFAIAVDNSGNAFVTGRSDRGAPTLSDYTTIKYNSNGDQQWVAIYNGPANGVDEANSIAVDNLGNVYVSGKSPGIGTSLDITTVKYNSNGIQQWVQRLNGTGNGEDYSYSMTVDADGNVYVTGTTANTATGADLTVVKYDTDGNQLWLKKFNGVGNGGDVGKMIKTDPYGNVYVTGFTDGGSSTTYDYVTVKYNSSGVQQWLRTFNGSGNRGDFANALVVDASGNVIVTGGSIGTGIGVNDSNFTTVKYNSFGTMLWISLYNGPNNSTDVARSIAVDNGGNIYVTGGSVGSGLDDYATVKYNPSGAEQWVIRYNGPGNANDYTNSIAVDYTGNVFVTGKSYGLGTDYDAATVKYSEVVGINPVNSEIPQSYNLYQNYPNPFNPSTIISFDLPKAGFVKLNVYDLNGKLVSSIVNSEMLPAKYSFTWNSGNASSGIYFYTLTISSVSGESYTSTKKMMLVK